ncbi:MAG: hypothetical protein ACYCT0_13355 [Sulfobacillus sp.]
MAYLVWTYLGLLASSVSGAFLFFGFALFGPRRRRTSSSTVEFRRPTIPFSWVTVHVLLATVTLGLFTMTIIRGHFR